MITESVNRPDSFALLLLTLAITLLGCPARAILLVIIATIVCGRSAPSRSAWTINAGRRFEVRKFESGNRTKTTSPRGQFIVGSHFGPIPILGKLGKPSAQIGRLRFVYASVAKIDPLGGMDPRNNDA
jgi:predicted LPLAT superfamily acyltransferase